MAQVLRRRTGPARVRRAGRARPRAWRRADCRGRRRSRDPRPRRSRRPCRADSVASACTCAGGQCSVSMPDEVGPPNGVATPKRSLRLAPAALVAAGKARAHFAECARARLRRDAVEHDARGTRARRAPVGRARRHQVGLRAQDHAVLDHLEPVGGERRARRGDVDDQLGGAGRRRALGRARAFDDPVVGDAVRGEEIARQVHVFGGEPHLAVVLEAERGRDIVEIGHAVHVDPGLRHRHHHIGVAEAERRR